MVKSKQPLNINSNGALRKAAGVTAAGKVNVTKVRRLAKGAGVTAQRARFYLNVLRGGK
jgi:hypothetical protein